MCVCLLRVCFVFECISWCLVALELVLLLRVVVVISVCVVCVFGYCFVVLHVVYVFRCVVVAFLFCLSDCRFGCLCLFLCCFWLLS